MRSETFHTPRPLAVTVKLPRGDVQVTTVPGEEATVTLDGGGDRARRQIDEAEVTLVDRGDHDELVVDVDPDDITFGNERFKLAITLGGRKDNVDVRIQVPPGTVLRAATGSADIRANGSFGAVETKTGSGDVTIDEVERDASVKVARGDVKIDRVGGSLKVQSAAGDV